jgi:hypothetical protein
MPHFRSVLWAVPSEEVRLPDSNGTRRPPMEAGGKTNANRRHHEARSAQLSDRWRETGCLQRKLVRSYSGRHHGALSLGLGA